jgi:hypothetical protein
MRGPGLQCLTCNHTRRWCPFTNRRLTFRDAAEMEEFELAMVAAGIARPCATCGVRDHVGYDHAQNELRCYRFRGRNPGVPPPRPFELPGGSRVQARNVALQAAFDPALRTYCVRTRARLDAARLRAERRARLAAYAAPQAQADAGPPLPTLPPSAESVDAELEASPDSLGPPNNADAGVTPFPVQPTASGQPEPEDTRADASPSQPRRRQLHEMFGEAPGDAAGSQSPQIDELELSGAHTLRMGSPDTQPHAKRRR